MRYSILSLAGFFLIIVGFMCSRHGEIHKWESIDPKVDSITIVLEECFHEGKNADSISALVGKIAGMMTTQDINSSLKNQLKGRYWYWQTKIAARLNKHAAAREYLRKAFSTADSVKSPYLFWKLVYEREKLRENFERADIYRLLKAYDYFKHVGDRPMEAAVSVLIGNLFNSVYQPEMGLEYLSKADSIYGILDYKEYRMKIRLNIASSLSSIGLADSAVCILQSLLNDSLSRKDPYFHNTVLRNLYAQSNNVEYLRKAYDMISNEEGQEDLKVIYCALLGKEYLDGGNRDTALRLIDYAIRNIESTTSFRFKSIVSWSAAEKYRVLNEYDSAYYWQGAYLAFSDSVESAARSSKTMAAHYFHALSSIKEEKEKDRISFLTWLAVAIVGFILIFFILLVYWIKKRQKFRLSLHLQHMKYIESELERERGNRHIMALSLARQESERIIDAVKEKVDNLVKAGNMDPNVLRDLRSDLRNHIFQQSDWQTFEQAFKTTNPDFIPRLYNRCKSLSPMQVKLASLILVGMSIKEIAGYLNIKEDSVMQARWRLRNKLGLTKEDPIEEFLHRINNGLE